MTFARCDECESILLRGRPEDDPKCSNPDCESHGENDE